MLRFAVAISVLCLSVQVQAETTGSVETSTPIPSSASERRQAPVPPNPRPAGTDSLLADVERIISAFESEGWFDDSSVYAEIKPVLLESVCRAPLGVRQAALAQLRSQRKRDPRRLFEQAGRKLNDEVKEALHIERQVLALEAAIEDSELDCPFWVTPEADFVSRQTTRNQFALHLEGGGIVQLRNVKGDLAVGAGGNSRVMAGYGVGDHLSLIGGLEFGGGALLKESSSGQFTINYLPAVPLLVRFRNVAWHYDLELAPVALFESSDTRLSFGGRLGFNIGVSVLRARGILPWAGIGVAVEHYFPGGGREATQFLRGGLRVGFRWAP